MHNQSAHNAPLPHPALVEILAPAYGPCRHFPSQGGNCKDARWDPSRGHIPRGFLGAAGALNEVALVMVFAEPGHPYADTDVSAAQTPAEFIQRAVHGSVDNRAKVGSPGSRPDVFHTNVRWFIDQCFPGSTPEEQLRKVWQTEARLCSVTNEIGPSARRLCGETYLGRQFDLLCGSVWVAFGKKAQATLDLLTIEYVLAYALSPPGCRHTPAKPSWEAAIRRVKART